MYGTPAPSAESQQPENCEDIERFFLKRATFSIMLGNNYKDYEDAFMKVNLDTLENRREEISKSPNEISKCMFPRE